MDMLPDVEPSLPAFSVVIGCYYPRCLKPGPVELKTTRCGVKYIVVARAVAVNWFQRTLLGDMQRGLSVRDTAWHDTEP